MEIREPTIARAWPRVLSKVLNLGQPVYIPDYGMTLELDEPLMVRISDPLHDRVCKGSGWGEARLEDYYQQCITPLNKFGHDYTYGERFLAYPTYNKDGVINQIEENMNTLESDISSRRAVSVSWIPKIDGVKEFHPPCMILQQRVIRNRKLNLTAYFRSNDMFGAGPSNYYALARWDEEDAEHLGMIPGAIYIISNCAHIYWYNWEEACNVSGNEKIWEELKSRCNKEGIRHVA